MTLPTRWFVKIAVALTVALMPAAPAGAATYALHADGSGDFPTIQAAVNAAANGDVLELYPGTYSGSGNVDVDYVGKAITIRSRFGIAAQVVISCEAFPLVDRKGFVFHSGEGPGSVLQAVTIRGGQLHSTSVVGGAGIECWLGASPTIRRCVIEDCSSYFMGGGIAVSGDAHIEDCTIRYNSTSEFSGGGLGIIYGSPTIVGCVFEGNSTSSKGGGASASHESTPQFTDCLFLGNDAIRGGGFYGSGSFDGCVFAGNTADSLGGAVSCFDSVRVSGCTFYGNGVAGGSGAGGVFVEKWEPWPGTPTSHAILENTIVAYGSAGRGIGCSSERATVEITCSNVYGNPGGDYTDCVAGQNGMNGNISADPRFCDAAHDDFDLDVGSPCLPANNLCAVQIGARGEGCVLTGGPERGPGDPAVFRMGEPSPSPFTDMSTVRFGIPTECRARLTVHDVAGRCVAVLLDRPLSPGWHEGAWNGRSDSARRAASGVYFFRLEAGRFASTRKVVRLR